MVTGSCPWSRRLCAGRLPMRCRVPASGVFLFAAKVVVLACRSGVRTFGAAWCWRTSLACLLGALAAAPGSVAMLAHRLPAGKSLPGLLQKSFEHLHDGFLFAARQLGKLLSEFLQARRRSRFVCSFWGFDRAEQFAGWNAEDAGDLLHCFDGGVFRPAFKISHHCNRSAKPLRKLRLSPSALLPQRRQAFAERRGRFRCWSSCHIGRTIRWRFRNMRFDLHRISNYSCL